MRSAANSKLAGILHRDTALGTKSLSLPSRIAFLMIKEGTADGNAPLPSMTVVLNWTEELKAKLPVK